MKQLKFEHSFVKDIIEGSRRTTIRIDDKHLQVGETVQVVDKVSSNKPQEWEVPGELTITGKQEFILSTLPLELLKDAEIGAANREQLYTFLRRFYGESISEDTVITLFTFQFEAYQQPVPYLVKTALEKENKPESVFVYADGGSRGNPGPSAAGFVIESEDKTVLQTWNKYLGITTNNQAEYHGLVAALEWCKQQHIQEVHVRLDSLLVVNQMNGQFKVKNRDLWTLYEAAKKLQATFTKITFSHVPREMNKRADAEVNKALDAVKGSDIVQ